MTKCPLCDPIEKKTDWLYEDEKILIIICETCEIPMVIFRRHGKDSIPTEWYKHAEKKVKEIFKERFLYFRTFPRQIMNHIHWHCVVKGGG